MQNGFPEFSTFEKAALTILLRDLNYEESIAVMRDAEPGWSKATYGRRLDDAFISLERKGLVSRQVEHGFVKWRITKKITNFLSSEQLSDLIEKYEQIKHESSELKLYLSNLRQQLEAALGEKASIQVELDALKQKCHSSLENRLISKFPKLGLNSDWIQALILLALLEIMARYKLSLLHHEESKDKNFTELLNILKKVIPNIEKRDFNINKDFVKALRDFRNKMVHHGLTTKVSTKEVEGIFALVEDLYKKLFEEC
ncbi:MAG: hypothetical protein Q8O16_02985 [Dehalococcoidia bacterium]|nr:hypothetical protein [Dehalococcoidia bacterium]